MDPTDKKMSEEYKIVPFGLEVPSVLERLHDQGRMIYEQNPNMRAFANVMTHPEFQAFFEKYLSTWEDCQTTMMIMNTASFIRKSYKTKTGEDITGFQLVALLKSALDDRESRQAMVDALVEFSHPDK